MFIRDGLTGEGVQEGAEGGRGWPEVVHGVLFFMIKQQILETVI